MKCNVFSSILTIPLFLFFSNQACSQIVINEFLLDDRFLELKNISDANVNISDYYLVSGGQPQRIGSHIAICSGVQYNLAPGAIFGWDNYENLSAESGEIILFNSNATSDPDAAVHYVQWGVAGQAYESIADSADLWTSGDFVPPILNGGSIEYNGSGYQSSDWTNVAVHSLCDPNGTGCETLPFTEELSDIPFSACVGNGNPEYIGYNFFGNTFSDLVVLVLDGENKILGFSESNENLVDLNGLTPEDTVGIHTRLMGYHGPIANLEIGQHVDSLIGCYYYGPPHAMEVYFLEEGVLSAVYHDSTYTYEIQLCATDSLPDEIKFFNTAEMGQNAFVAFNDENNRVFSIQIDSMTLQLDGTEYSDIVVYSFTFQDSLEGDVGDLAYGVSGFPCSFRSENEIYIETDVCINASHDLDFEKNNFKITPNPAKDKITLTELPSGSVGIEVFDLLGHRMISTLSSGSTVSREFSISSFPAGLYIVTIKGQGFHTQKIFMKETD